MVQNLRDAVFAYNNSETQREQQAAYHEILLYGGEDGYSMPSWRRAVARYARKFACWVERK